MRSSFQELICSVSIGAALLGSACSNSGTVKNKVVSQVNQSTPSWQDSELFHVESIAVNLRRPSEFNVQSPDQSVYKHCQTTSTQPVCQCVFEFKLGGTRQERTSPITYLENHLSRCPIVDIPGTAEDRRFWIREIASLKTSNPIELSEETLQSAVSIDTTQISNFADVKRYQCRDMPWVPYLFQTNTRIMDPFQSNNPDLGYPLNFYTTSPFQTAQALRGAFGNVTAPYGQSGDARDFFDCTFDPNASWSNFKVFSDAGGAPISNSLSTVNNKNSFLVSRYRGSVFTEPVHAMIAPYTLSQFQAGATDIGYDPMVDTYAAPLGYAAKSITTGNNQERCPSASEVTIPSGYQFVKLWAFSGSLSPRRFVNQSLAVSQTGEIACNPGDYGSPQAQSANYTTRVQASVFGDCVGVKSSQWYQNMYPFDAYSSTNTYATANPPNTDMLRIVARIFNASTSGGGVCVIPGSSSSSSIASSFVPKFGQNSDGSDHYKRIPAGSFPAPGGAAGQSLTWSWGTTPLPSASASSVSGATPLESNSSNIGFDSLDGNQDRMDYLFVTSPESVSFNQMKNQLQGSEPYRPITFHNSYDCANPTNANDASCAESQKVVFGLHSMSIGEDSSSGSDHTFPLCVLQKVGLPD